jgi:hypothetical protein
VEFEWDGMKLIGVTGYQFTGDLKNKTKVYDRRLSYSAGALSSEQIHYQSQTARITYKYEGNRLASASFDGDASINGRSGEVLFGQ